MNAYLFTAGCTTTQMRQTPSRGGSMIDTIQTWDGCASAIVYGGDAEQAQKRFEAWLLPPPNLESPAQVEIKRLIGAELVDQLFMETGGKLLDWRQIDQQMVEALQNTAVDDFEQGYWVDINQTLPPGAVAPDVESLQRDLPEDIRSGLNWSPDKQFFFLVSVFSPPRMPVIPTDEPDAAVSDHDTAEEKPNTNEETKLDETIMALAEMRDRETAALVQARNSVVAGWLWRRFAADTRLALNEIHIAPCCPLIAVE